NVATHGLVIFDAMARCLKGALLLEQRDALGLPVMSDALAQLGREHIGLRYPMYAGMHAQGLLRFGRQPEARIAIDAALEWSNAHDELWCLPELIRIKADILSAFDGLDAQYVCESLYMQAVELARRQGALSFELRAATSLARLEHRRGRT